MLVVSADTHGLNLRCLANGEEISVSDCFRFFFTSMFESFSVFPSTSCFTLGSCFTFTSCFNSCFTPASLRSSAFCFSAACLTFSASPLLSLTKQLSC